MDLNSIKEKVMNGESVTLEELTFLIDEMSTDDLSNPELKDKLVSNYKDQLMMLKEENDNVE